MTRAEANAAGKVRYFTGEPCRAGHLAERYVTTGSCVMCQRAASERFRRNAAQAHVAALRGHFSYPLHPDDQAAALAYCQALDLQRGRAPHVPTAAPAPRDEAAVYAQIAAHRERVAGSLGASPDFLSSLPTGVLNFPTNGS